MLFFNQALLPHRMSSYFLTGYMLFWSVQPSESKRHLLGNERASLGYNEPFADVDYRQSFCSQYEMAVNNSLPTESALEGRQVNVLISGYRTNYNEETGLDPEYPGLFPKILDEIAELGNFTWRQSFGITEKNGTDKNYSELLQWGTHAYDIYVSDWDITSERINLGTAFTSPVLDSKIIMIRNVGPDGKDKIEWFFWFAPFKTGVWLVFIAQIIVSGFVYQFLDFLGEGRDKRSFRQRTVDNQHESCLSYFGMSSRFPTSSAARLFIVSNYVWVLFIGTAYTANLTSYMVVNAKPTLVLNTIQDAIENDMSMCIETMTNQEAYITRKYPDAVSLLVPKESVRDMYTAINEGECDVVLGERQDYDAYKLKNEFNPDCHLTWQGRPVLEIDTGFATLIDPGQKCTLLVSEVFTYYLEKLSEDGTLAELWNTEVESGADQTCDANNYEFYDGKNRRHLQSENSDGDNKSNSGNDDNSSSAGSYESSLSLKSMAGIFLLHLCFSVIAIIIGMFSYFQEKEKADQYKRSVSRVTSKEEFGSNSNVFAQDHLDFPVSSQVGNDGKIDALLSMITQLHDEQKLKEVESEKKMDDLLSMMTKIQEQQKQ